MITYKLSENNILFHLKSTHCEYCKRSVLQPTITFWVVYSQDLLIHFPLISLKKNSCSRKSSNYCTNTVYCFTLKNSASYSLQVSTIYVYANGLSFCASFPKILPYGWMTFLQEVMLCFFMLLGIMTYKQW